MILSGWEPVTFEDHLLSYYLEDYPGQLFLEVEVGNGDNISGPRRLDGLLIPDEPKQIRPQGSYNREEIASAVMNKQVHVLEAKRKLNRNVIGQVHDGVALLEKEFFPASVQGVALCAQGNPDLEWYCFDQGINVALYPKAQPTAENTSSSPTQRVDHRNPPDLNRRRAFIQGWNDAVSGTLYKSVKIKKTHANIGNLFGWIYGDKSEEFKQETWERYIESID